jgi:hypothetical protein
MVISKLRNKSRVGLMACLLVGLSACGTSTAPSATAPSATAPSATAPSATAPSATAPSATAAGTWQVTHFDGPIYTSVKELGEAGDLIISGTVGKLYTRISESQLRGTPEVPGNPSLPLALYEVHVDRELKGAAESTILVTRIDTDKLNTDAQTPFRSGQGIMLFLKASTVKFDGVPVHAVVGMDQGKLEIAEGRVRASAIAGASPQGPAVNGRSVDEIAAQL